MMRSGKFFFFGLIIFILLILYGSIDPAASNWFPKCPFLSLTGYQCPGCGSQRAIYQLLRGELFQAYQYNPLLVLSLPYIFLGLLFEIPSMKNKYQKAQKILFGYKSIYIVLGIIIVFWILRNVIT